MVLWHKIYWRCSRGDVTWHNTYWHSLTLFLEETYWCNFKDEVILWLNVYWRLFRADEVYNKVWWRSLRGDMIRHTEYWRCLRGDVIRPNVYWRRLRGNVIWHNVHTTYLTQRTGKSSFVLYKYVVCLFLNVFVFEFNEVFRWLRCYPIFLKYLRYFVSGNSAFPRKTEKAINFWYSFLPRNGLVIYFVLSYCFGLNTSATRWLTRWINQESAWRRLTINKGLGQLLLYLY